MSSTANSTETTIWTTPAGVIELCEGGRIRFIVGSEGGNGASVVLEPPAISTPGDEFLLNFSETAQGGEGLTLEVAAQGVQRIPLPSLVRLWRRSPAAHFPQVLQLARSIARACRELDQLRPARFLLSPVQVFWCVNNDREHWGLAALPLSSPKLEEFAASSPEVLAWLTADAVLGTGALDWARTVGAVIYYCVAGEVFPGDLPQSERIRRLLQNHAGNAARLRSALTLALPKALSARGVEFAGFLWSLLSPTHADTLNPAQMSRRFDEFVEEFSAPRLAGAWEVERNPRLAVEILNVFSRSAPSEDVPWQTIARLRALTGDSHGAEEVIEKHPDADGTRKPSVISRLRNLAAKGAEGREALETEVARIRAAQPSSPGASPASPLPSGEEFLYLAYADGRWLGRTDEALQLLDRDFSVSWYKVIREVLAARFDAERESWPKVSWHCREARHIIEKLPDQGGVNGRYVSGYIDALDGIAHLKAVEGGLGAAYLGDALVKMQSAWVKLSSIAPGTLDASLAGWLGVLTRAMQGRAEVALLAISADAFCQAEGIPLHAPDGMLPLPWFSEEYLFTP
jgi:hypothetical protein